MSRKIWQGINQPIGMQISALGTYDLGTTTSTVISLAAPIQAPAPGARILKWWIKNTTKGTGTGTTSLYLVASGGTSSTRQIAGTISFSQTAAANTFEGDGWAAGMYEIATGDTFKALDLVVTNSTTSANAPGNTSFGVIWGY